MKVLFPSYLFAFTLTLTFTLLLPIHLIDHSTSSVSKSSKAITSLITCKRNAMELPILNHYIEHKTNSSL